MPDLIEVVRMSLNDDMNKIQTVSKNLANVNTLGYKREVDMSYPVVFEGVVSGNPGLHGRKTRDLSPGHFKGTDNAMDLAILSDGYFELVNKQGRSLYSRRGNFQIDEHGQLTLGNGVLLQGEKGVVRVSDDQFTVDKSGNVIENQQIVNRIRIAMMPAANSQYLGDGLFASEKVEAVADEEMTIRQFMLETSNVDNTQEMLSIIEASRRFESASKLLTTYDKMVGESINTLGEF